MSLKSFAIAATMVLASVSASQAVTASAIIGLDGAQAFNSSVDVPEGDTDVTLGIGINTNTAYGVGSFTIDFDPAILQFNGIGATAQAPGGLIIIDLLAPDTVDLLDITFTGVSTGLDIILEASFTVLQVPADGDTEISLGSNDLIPFLTLANNTLEFTTNPVTATLNFTVEPIPLPASAWMMIGALALGGLLARKRAQRAA